jgi:amino acid adenylation domain-containing protein
VEAVLDEKKRRLLALLMKEKGIDPAKAPVLPLPRGGEPAFPLSFAQERLWVIDQLEPGNLAYNLPTALRLSGRLRPEVLGRVFAEIVRRHEALRTTFGVGREGRPVQVISSPAPVPVPWIDLADLPGGAREAELRRLAIEEGSTPFDLARGPVLRVRLIRLASEEHALLLTLHHIASDGWSNGVLVGEVVALYDAFSRGGPSPLPPLPVQYADYASWQRQAFQGDALERALAWWRERLTGAPVLELPTDRPRPAVQGLGGSTVFLERPAALAGGLKALARAEGATLFMVVTAACQALLARLSGQPDLTVGTPVANRHKTEVEGLIGFFVNTLVLRTDLSGDPPFRELLARVRRVAIGAFEHGEVPFSKVVEEVRPERSLSHTPLFQVMCALGNAPSSTLEIPGLRFTGLDAPVDSAMFDLNLTVVESRDGLATGLEYRTDLFDRTTALRLLGAYATVLEAIVSNPDLRLSELPLLTPPERQALLVEWNDPAGPEAAESLEATLAASAKRNAEKPALVFEGRSFTFREVDERAGRLAGRLRGMEVGPGTLVGLSAERSPETLVRLFAVLEAGAAYVPLDPSYPAERLAFMLEDSGATVLLDQDFEEGEDGREGGEASPEDLAYVIYTSGSTGRPKGVGMPRGSVANLLAWQARHPRLSQPARTLQFTSLSFDVSFQEIVSTWIAGGTLVLVSEETRRDFFALLDLIDRERVERLFLPFVALRQLAEAAEARGRGGESLRDVVTAGEQLQVTRAVHSWFGRLPECRLHNQYGPTESHVVVTALTLADDPASWPAHPSIGRPLARAAIRLLDPALQPVPAGVPGEIHIGGAALARGYLDRPELTAERFVPDPFGEPGDRLYRTGDLARWRTDGTVEYLGRRDGQVKIRGVRVEPGEVETALDAHPGVRGAVAVPRAEPGSPGALRLVAFYVPAPGAEPGSAELRDFLAARLPAAIVPSLFIPLEAFPTTPSGKVDRRALATGDAFAGDHAGPSEGYAPPRSQTEELLAGVWSALLGAGRVGVHDNFFALGGHSLLATQLVSRVREVFRVEIPQRALFEAPTVEELARVIEAASEGPGAALLSPIERVPGDGPFPLSFAQERLWLVEQIDPGNAAYNMAAALRFEGILQPALLAAVLGEVVRRHATLRTTYGTLSGAPVQIVHPAAPVDLPVIDLAALPSREAEARRLAGEEILRPFDLARGPVLRASLLRMGPGDHVLVFNMHHIASDGWSTGVLVREVMALYGGSPLPELPVRYVDYAAWQRKTLQGEVLEAALGYWRERLEGVPVLELPTDRPRPALQIPEGAVEPLAVPIEVSEALKALGRRQGATLFMTLAAAFEALLSRHAGQTDFGLGTPVAGRGRVELEDLIGFFVNTLVIRADLGGDPSFAEILARVREASLGAFAHQEMPFERIVEELHPERSLSHSPLFQAMFVLQNAPGAVLEIPGLTAVPFEAEGVAAKFDLTLSLADTEEGLAGGMEYRTSLFDAATVRRLLVRFNTLLAGIVAGPDRRLSELPLLPEAERREIVAWSGPRATFPVSAGLHEIFAARAALAPEAVAVTFEDGGLTYGELNARANRLARRLRRLGVGPESRVGLAVERSADLVVGILGILKAGGAYVPLDPSYPEERLAFLLADSDAPVLLTQGHLADRLPAHRGYVVLLDDPALAEESGEDLASPVFPDSAPDSAAYVIYTSGSTGRPKGTVVTHGNVVRLLAATNPWFGFGPGDVWTLFHSFAFDFSVWEIWGALLFGGRLVVVPYWVSRSPEAFLDLLVREGVTVVNQTPSAFRQLVAAEEEGGAPDLSLRLVIFGGEALDLQGLAPWLERHGDERPRLVNMYGITETTVHVTYRPISRQDLAEPFRSPIGVPIPDLSIYLLDPSGQPVPIGVPGEMVVGGAGLARGYLGRPDLTAERYVPGSGGERLYRSGDLARWRPSGEIDYLGRIDHQVKVRGFRIELGEIEAALAAHPAVQEAVVLVRDEADDRRLVAYLGMGEGEAPSAAELRGFISGRLPDYMVPAAFVILPALPLTAHGKVDRRALAEIRPEGGPDRAWEPPETVTEAVLASLWAEVLAVPQVGVSDDFFALGGHSLLGTRLVARVREAFGVEIPLRALFEGATVRDLARRIESAEREDVPPIVPVPREGGPLPPSFSQERLWLVDQIEPGTATYNMPSALRLAGPLRSGLLAAVFAGIVRRHEVLRTTFATAGGAPVQVVHPPAPFLLPVADLGGLPADLREEEARRLAAEEVLRPFDLARGPVLRAGLLRLGAEDHVLLFTLHHIAADGWSVGVLVREVMAFYGSFSAGRPSPLPELPVQYADYAVWQRRVFGGERLAASLGFWRERLADVPVLEMPTDRPRPAVQTAEGDTEPLEVPAGVAAALGNLGRREGATLFMVLAAAWEVLLSRYSAQTDFAVGTPVAGRDRVELEGLIGFFVNTLVLRANLGGDPPFRELLGRVREGAFAAFARQEVPFERLVEELQPERSLSHSPLFQVMLVLQNAPAEALELPGLTPLPFDAGGTAAKFDLTLSFVETGEGLAGALEYRTSLFDAATIRRMLGHLGVLLAGIAADPDRRLSDLPLMPEPERTQVLFEWSRAESVFPETAPLAELFAHQAERTPEAMAVVSASESLTYRELDRQANRLARRLARMGVGPEVPVALLLDRSPAQTVAALAVVKAGGAYVPLDPGHPAERLAFILADTAAPVVVTEEGLLPLLPESPARVLCLDRDRVEIEAESPEPWDGGASADALLYVMYTSGSTGTPKGVAVVHRGAARLARWAREELGIGPGDVLLQLSPFVFDGSTLELWGAILSGATVAVPPPGTLSREEIGREVGRHGVTVLWLTAGLFHQMAEGPLTDLASLRLLLAGGDVLSVPYVRRVLRELPGTAFGNGYGPTENTTGTACALFTGPDVLGASVPIGRPLSGTRVFLFGPDGQPVPAGVPGELCAGGQGLARGYLGRPERTAESFVPDPFADSPGERLYRTGDLARFLPDGRLDFLGRIDQQVKIRGFRVEPGEVEAALAGHPEVAECAVVVGKDAAGKRLVACIVSRDPEAPPSTADFRAWLATRLPEPLVPAAFVALPSLPLNANGKVDRRALARIPPEPVRSGGIEAPRTPAEALLAGLWAEVLGLPEVGIRDDFFDLGGHSLLGTRLVSRVRETFGVELPLRALFEAPTVEALVAHIKAAGEDRALPALVAEPRESLPPLSFAQERLWVVDQLEPGGTAYNLPSAQRLVGALRPDVLARVFREIACRHETLRTTFDVPEAGASPVQIVAPPSAVHLSVADLAALPSEEREAAVRRLAMEEGGRPFDLVHGPVWRATLIRLAEREHALLVTMHHIASDGWSLGVLSQEVAALYEAFSAGLPSPLPELPVQYADYAVRERRLFAAGAMDASLDYWKRQLAGAPVLELPTDRPRSASPGAAAGVEALDLPADLSAALNALARQGGATLFMGMMAAWEALLSRYTGQEDLTVGTPVAGRLRTELEPLIGFFVNTLVLRADLAGDPSFREILARTRSTALAAFAHQEVPFERLVLELNPERSLAQTPLFQVMASLHNMPAVAAEIPGLAFLTLETAGATAAKFDLTLAATETEEGLALVLEYRATLFDAATIRRMLAHFATLVAGIAADPGARLSELPLLREAERRQVLFEWSRTEAVFPETVPLAEDFERQVRETPEALALASAAESLTYRELDRRANRLARKLRRLGVGPEVPVGLFLDRSIGRIVATLAVVKAGGAYVPLDPAHPAERLAFILADTAAPVVVTDAGLLPALSASSSQVLCLDRDREEIEGESGEPLGVRVSVDALLYVMYTSGSTGTPKGVAVVHRGVSRLVRWGREAAGFGPGDVLPQLASYAFDASVLEVWGTLLSGATLTVPPPGTLSLEEIGREVARHGATILWLTTGLFHQMAEGDLAPLARLRLILTGGDVTSAPHVRRTVEELPGTSLIVAYGPTENSSYTSTFPAGREPMGASVPLGRPISGTRVIVLDRAGQPVPIGVPGELCTGGDGVARGYLGRPERTAEAFVPDPFADAPGERLYRTGDLVRFLPDGRLDFLGRIDQQVKIRGFRVEPGEVEAVLASHPEIAECAVVVGKDATGKRLVACVVPRDPEAPPMAADLRAWLGARLPDPLVPAAFVTLPSLPLYTSGKVDRRALSRISPEPVRSGGIEAPRTGTEALLAELWAEVLGVPAVGIRDSFFDLGGHSLLATRLVSRVRQVFGVDLPLRDLFEGPTVAELARRVEAGERGSAPPIVPVPRDGGPLPLSFTQERLWFLDQLDPGTPTLNMPGSFRLPGDLDAGTLSRALDEVVRRHESLRTTFGSEVGTPFQRIAPPFSVPLPVVDLSGLAPEAVNVEAGQIGAGEAGLSFDLARGPLLRTLLLRRGEEGWTLLLTLHHIVSDGWSMGLLARELGALYRSSAELPAPPVQYADYAVWQRRWLSGEKLAAQIAYWRGKLADAPVLDLPTDRPRPAVQTYRGASVPHVLSPDLSARLAALARREGATLFMLLLAAFQALLSRLSGQEDVVVGSPVAGRVRAEVEGLIGCFLNNLALRTGLSGNPTFRELLGRARATALEAYAHQDIPFEKLLEELSPKRDLSRTPVFQVFLNMLNFPADEGGLTGAGEGGTAEVASKFDLTIYAAEAAGEIRLDLVYNADLFDRERVEEMAAQLERILARAAEAPETRIAGISLVTDAARAVLPDPARPLDDAFQGAVPDALARHAARFPDRVAVADAGTALTYGELAAAAEGLAGLLASRGVERGDVVAVWAHRSATLSAAVLGILRAGAAFLILDPAYPPSRLVDYLRIGRPRAFVAIAGAAPPLPEVEAELPSIRIERPAAGLPAPRVAVGPDDLAVITFTSGSMGRPKGVAGRHGPLTHFYPWMAERFGLSGDDRFGMLSALSHDPLQRDLFTPVWLAGALSVPDPERIGSPGYLAEWVRREGVTVLHLTPAMLELLVQAAEETGVEMPSLRRAFVVGDLLKRTDVERLYRVAPGVTCINLYGSTETQRSVSYFVIPREARRGGREVLPLGQGMEDVQLLVLNPAGQLAGIGELGEIHLRSAHLALGYLDDPALTAERFLPDGADARLYRTGDLGRYRPDGNTEFAGRADAQVKIRGFRIEPGEVEAALARFPGVREGVVIVREDRPGDRRLAAYAVPRPGADLSPDDLRAFLAGRLPGYMVPADVVVLPALPLTRTGKVDRRALPAPERAAGEGIVAPRTPTEETLAGLWRDLLDVPEVGVHDDFFDLGGHSLLATRLLSRVRSAFGVELPLRSLFEAPTLEALAARIETAEQESLPPILPVPRDGRPLPLSFAQERLWFLDRLDPGTPTLNLPGSIRLHGVSLSPAALARAVAEAVRRHEALRTTFGMEEGRPFQHVAPEVPVLLPVADLRDLPSEARRREAARLEAEEALLPFDLERGPLFRARLLRLEEDDWAFLLTLHHVISDGWSKRLLERELGLLYGAFAAGKPSPLPPLPVQYADYAVWQRSRLPGDLLDVQLAYWRRQLEGAPILDLPTDRPRPAVQTYRGASVLHTLGPELSGALAALARKEGATLFMVLLAGFSALLSRLSGQEDVVVGSPIAGRIRAEIEGVVGCFLNNLALRTGLAGAPTFRELLRRARTTALEAYAHQDVPFERLLEELRPERDLSRTPVFQVLLNMLNLPAGEGGLSGGAQDEGGTPETPAKFDLTIYAAEAAGKLHLHLVYNADLFDRERIAEMAAQLELLLAQGAADPVARVGEIPLATPAARAVLPDPALDLPLRWPGSISERVAHRALESPEAVAAVDRSGFWTYGQLDGGAGRLAGRLSAAGVRPGDVVAVYAHRGAALAAALLGIWKAGAAFVILDPAYPAARLASVLALAQPAAWVVLEGAGAPAAEVEEILASHPRVALPETADGWEQALAGTAPASLPIEPRGLAYLAFTSGSTGVPKGIAGTHAPLSHFLDWHAETFDLGASDRGSVLSGLAHDPLLRDLFAPLWTGGTLCVPDPDAMARPGWLSAWMARERVTVAHLTPAMGQLLAQDAAPGSLPDLRRAFFAGDVLTGRDLARVRRLAPAVRPVNFYGATETPQAMGWFEAEGGGSGRVPIGRGIEGVQLLILNRSGRLAGLGELGEIHVRTPYLAQGYLGEAERTRESFLPDPGGSPAVRLYRTGDLGRYRLDGNAEIAGRADAQIKIRGFRVEPEEVAAAVLRYPGIEECAVVAREDLPGDRRLVAYVVPEPGAEVTAPGLRSFLAALLPGYMVPAAVVTLPALPLTRTGKLDRRALPAPERVEGEIVLPRTPEEARLAGIWRDLLGVERIGVHDGFFDLGGHSLLATRLLSRVQEAFGVELPLRVFFERPTIEGMAAELAEGAERGPSPALVRLAAGGSGTPFFCVHPAGGTVFCYADLARELAPDRSFYGLQSPGVQGGEPAETIEEMAAAYLAEVLAVQPAGPYLLGGWSLGGAVAFEMARQLSRQGREVGLVAILDTQAPGTRDEERLALLALEDADFALKRLAEELGPAAAQALRDEAGVSLDLSAEERLERILAAARRAGLLPADLGTEPLRRLIRIYRTHIGALGKYRPGPYAGRTLLVRATEGAARQNPTLGWNGLLTGEWETVDVPGDHQSMMAEPALRDLARVLRERLN